MSTTTKCAQYEAEIKRLQTLLKQEQAQALIQRREVHYPGRCIQYLIDHGVIGTETEIDSLDMDDIRQLAETKHFENVLRLQGSIALHPHGKKPCAGWDGAADRCDCGAARCAWVYAKRLTLYANHIHMYPAVTVEE